MTVSPSLDIEGAAESALFPLPLPSIPVFINKYYCTPQPGFPPVEIRVLKNLLPPPLRCHKLCAPPEKALGSEGGSDRTTKRGGGRRERLFAVSSSACLCCLPCMPNNNKKAEKIRFSDLPPPVYTEQLASHLSSISEV